MSKFPKRAKFLSILAAASAVGKASAGATTIPGYILPSVEAQNAVINANRNNLQVARGPRFSILKSIEPKSALTGGAVAGGATGITWLLTRLFSGNNSSKQDKYTKECLDYFIEVLKKNKIVEIRVGCEYFALRIRYYGSGNYRDIDELIGNALKDEFENTGDLEKEALKAAVIRNELKRIEIVKKLNIGRNAFIKNIMDTLGDDLSAAVEFDIDFDFARDKNGNILIAGKESNGPKTLEEMKKALTGNLDKEDKEEKLKAEAEAKVRIVEKLAKNELIKKALSVSEKKDGDDENEISRTSKSDEQE